MTEAPLDGFALSAQQARLWRRAALASLPPDAFRARAEIALEGELDAAVLRRAAAALVERHEALRTTFHPVPGLALPIQAVAEPVPPLWREDGGPAGEAAEARREAWDLAAAPALRLTLTRLGPGEHRLEMAAPSLCADERSLEVLFAELAQGYAALASGSGPEPDPPLQYLDFCAWQDELLAGEGAAAGRAFWTRPGVLPEPGPPARLPFEGPVPQGAARELIRTPVRLDGFDWAGAAARAGVPPSTFLLAAWSLLLARLSGRRHLALGMTFDGRKHAELREGVGLYARWLPVAVEVSLERSFRELARALATAIARTEENQEYSDAGGPDDPVVPEESIAPAHGFERRVRPPAIEACGVRFALRRCEAELALPSLRLAVFEDEAATAPRLELRADPASLPAEEAARLAERLETLLRAAAAEPDAPAGGLDLLGPGERRLVTAGWGDSRWEPASRACVHELFAAWAARTPEALAVRAHGVSLTYQDLDRRAGRLAQRLRHLGIGPERTVGIGCAPSVHLLVAILGVWKAGGAYAPLDPASPPMRKAALLAEAGARAVVGREADLGELPGYQGPVILLDREHFDEGPAEEGSTAVMDPKSLAYLIFTSGSTGAPKGVAVTHASLSHYSQWIAAELLAASDRPRKFASVSTPAADLGHTALFPALISGGSVHLLAAEARDAVAFQAALRREAIDVLKIVPGHLEALLPAEDGPAALPGTIVLGGDRLDWQLAERLGRIAPGSRLVNHYGPTEATVGALVCRLAERPGASPWEGSVPIGRPLGGARARILDGSMRPVPAGVAGELYLGGAGLARGYAGRPEVTAAAFVPDPWGDGERLYRTGDLARHLPDGAVEFLGRADDQVKIRGFRVEPGEIEGVLREHPGVREAAVLALQDRGGERRLAAFVVPRQGRGAARGGAAARPGAPPVEQTALAIEPAAGLELGTLPDGRPVYQLNRHETEFFYRQIFVDQGILRQGISLPAGACVFDVGANIGLFTLFVAERCPDAVVYAFEPVPDIFEALRRNAELHAPRARVFPFGLSDAAREVELTFYPRESCMSGSYADPERDRGTLERVLRNAGLGGDGSAAYVDRMLNERVEHRLVRCAMRTLSDVLRQEGIERVDLLKIDVERSELDVLRGVSEEDWPKIRQIVIEAHDVDGRLDAVCALLRRRGYRIVLEQEPELRGTELFNLYALLDGARETAPAPAGAPARPSLPGLVPEELRRFVAGRLPDFMVPSALIVLDELPRTPNGKLDRARLAELAAESGRGRPPIVPPSTLAEKALAEIWRDVLNVDEVGVEDNFFALGGDSIRMIQMRYRAEERGWSFPAQQVLETPVLRDLARAASPAGPAGAPPDPRTFELVAEADRARLPAGVEDAYPLTALQAGMLFHSAYTERSAAYKDVQSFHLRCRLDLPALEAALRQVVARHPALRTSFDLTTYGEPLQLVWRTAAAPIEIEDLRGLDPAGQEAAIADWIEREKRRSWDWSRPPLLRVAVHRRGEREVSLGLATHHAVLDGWSNAVLLSDWLRLYLAELGEAEPRVQPPPAVFRRLVELEREALAATEAERFWRERLADAPATLLARSGGQAAEGGTRFVGVPLAEDAPPRLESLARALGVPLKSVLLAVHLRVLALATGQPEIVTGLVASRRPEGPGADRAVGLFLTTLPLRMRLVPGTWSDLARSAFSAEREALAWRYYPVERLQRETGGGALFDSLFNYNHFHVLAEVRGLGGIEVLDWTSFEETNFALAASFDRNPVSGRLQLSLHVHPGVFDPDVDRLAGWFERALAALARDPEGRHEEARLLSPAEERQVLAEWSGAATAAPSGLLVPELVSAAARRSPAALAAAGPRGETLSWGELAERAGRLAGHLRRLGVGPDVPVGLFADPSPEMVIGIVGVLWAGGAYVPLDPDYPSARLERMIADAGAPVLVARRELRGRLSGGLARTGVRVVELETACLGDGAPPADPGVEPGHLAYVIFTSGSTGGPKGVLVSHGSLARSTLARREVYAGRVEAFLLLSSFSFDSSVAGLFWTLCDGGTLVLPDSEQRRDPDALAELAERYRVSHLLTLPALYEALLERAADRLRSLRTAVVAGEACPPGLAARHRERLPGVDLVNEYGPSEAAVWCTAGRAGEGETAPPIGRPIPGARLYLLDSAGQPVPPGVPGEIHLGGNLARGYAGRPEATADRFRPDPFQGATGERLYRTGDLARHLPDGRLEFLARVDRQVKIRGHRIELEEVEAALESLPAIAAAAVVDAPAGGGPAADPEELLPLLRRLPAAEAAALVTQAEAGAGRAAAAPPPARLVRRDHPAGFEVSVRIDRETFPAAPRENQRHWLLQRAVEELVDDLAHLDRVARRFIPGAGPGAAAAAGDSSRLVVDGRIVMEAWQAPVVEEMARIVAEGGGDILEIGFGMGLSATAIQRGGVRSHTLIECDDRVMARLRAWREGYPGRDIRPVHGRWQDTLESLGRFDGILFHANALDAEELLRYVVESSTFAEHFFPAAAAHLREGGVFTYFTTEIDSFSRRHQRAVLEHFRTLTLQVVRPLAPPADCADWWADSMVVARAVK